LGAQLNYRFRNPGSAPVIHCIGIVGTCFDLQVDAFSVSAADAVLAPRLPLITQCSVDVPTRHKEGTTSATLPLLYSQSPVLIVINSAAASIFENHDVYCSVVTD